MDKRMKSEWSYSWIEFLSYETYTQNFYYNLTSHSFGETCDKLTISSKISPLAFSNNSSLSNSRILNNKNVLQKSKFLIFSSKLL